MKREKLDDWCRANWDKLPALTRENCLKVLRDEVPRELLERWKHQHASGLRIGCDDLRFHFTNGMVARNVLRKVLPDEELPPVTESPGAHTYFDPPRNWDDYYIGALEELCETT